MRAVDIAREMEVQISTYILWTTLINGGLGVATTLAMWALGMPNPSLWGVLAFVTNFIPYLGGLVCTVIIGLAALVAFPDPGWAILVPLVFLLLMTGLCSAAEGGETTVTVAGRSRGRVMCRKLFHAPAPSTFAASKYSWGIATMPAM